MKRRTLLRYATIVGAVPYFGYTLAFGLLLYLGWTTP